MSDELSSTFEQFHQTLKWKKFTLDLSGDIQWTFHLTHSPFLAWCVRHCFYHYPNAHCSRRPPSGMYYRCMALAGRNVRNVYATPITSFKTVQSFRLFTYGGQVATCNTFLKSNDDWKDWMFSQATLNFLFEPTAPHAAAKLVKNRELVFSTVRLICCAMYENNSNAHGILTSNGWRTETKESSVSHTPKLFDSRRLMRTNHL